MPAHERIRGVTSSLWGLVVDSGIDEHEVLKRMPGYEVVRGHGLYDIRVHVYSSRYYGSMVPVVSESGGTVNFRYTIRVSKIADHIILVSASQPLADELQRRMTAKSKQLFAIEPSIVEMHFDMVAVMEDNAPYISAFEGDLKRQDGLSGISLRGYNVASSEAFKLYSPKATIRGLTIRGPLELLGIQVRVSEKGGLSSNTNVPEERWFPFVVEMCGRYGKWKG